MQNLPWLIEAKKFIGTHEIKGEKHNKSVLNWWKAIKMGGIINDEVPWCAAFVGGVLESVGIRSTRSGAARSYIDWGYPISKPVTGCIVVFSREGGGHVGFVMGHDVMGRLLVLGGNQGDEVCIKAFDIARVIGYRWPDANIPAYQANISSIQAELSTKEV